MRRAGIAAAMFVVLGAASAAPGAARRVADLGLAPAVENEHASASTRSWVRLGTRTCFPADDGIHGRELWCTEGTRASTRLVRDIYPGQRASDPQDLTPFGGALYFGAADPVHGCGLWRTDGTSTGTERVATIAPVVDCEVPGSSVPGGSPAGFAALDDALLFSAGNSTHGRELWRSDGTSAGTVLVADLSPGLDATGRAASTHPRLITSLGSVALFEALGGDDPRRATLWRSDGTEAGTFELLQQRPVATASGASAFTRLGELGVFGVLQDSAVEVWRSDGTAAGTYALGRFAHPEAARLAVWNGRAYFLSRESTEVETGLWSTDGTVGGTRRVGFALPRNLLDTTPELVPGRTHLFFTLGGRRELWASDGHPDGTRPILDAFSEPVDARGLTPFRDGVAFATHVPEVGCALHFTDGFAVLGPFAGPPGPPDACAREPFASLPPVAVDARDDALIYIADDGIHGPEPWMTDGTAEGTRLLLDIDAASKRTADGLVPASLLPLTDTLLLDTGALLALDVTSGTMQSLGTVDPGPRIRLGNRAVFAFNQDGDVRLLGTGGAPSTTEVFATIRHASVTLLTAIDERLALIGVGAPGADGTLWSTDGTTSGTAAVGTFAQPVHDVAVLPGGIALFAAGTDEHGEELWRSDGRESDTRLVKDIRPGSVGASLQLRGVHGGALYFIADDGVHGPELWRSDGTAQGTTLVVDANPGPAGLGSVSVAAAGAHTLALIGADASGCDRRVLWRLAPAPAEPIIEHTYDNCFAPELVGVGEHVLYVGSDAASGAELWRTDGTVRGTRRVVDINPGPANGMEIEFPSRLTSLYRFADRVAFLANDGVSGVEVWSSDGSSGGTHMLTDFNPRPPEAYYGQHGALLPLGDRLLFYGFEPNTGSEPWITDGTPAGTRLLADIAPGPLSSYPGDEITPNGFEAVGRIAVRFGDQIFLIADDARTGRELWQATLAEPTCAGDCDDDGTVSVNELVRGVGIALGAQPVGLCIALDDNRDGEVRIPELISGVQSLLAGCPAFGGTG